MTKENQRNLEEPYEGIRRRREKEKHKTKKSISNETNEEAKKMRKNRDKHRKRRERDITKENKQKGLAKCVSILHMVAMVTVRASEAAINSSENNLRASEVENRPVRSGENNLSGVSEVIRKEFICVYKLDFFLHKKCILLGKEKKRCWKFLK